ncbi:MAG: tRNA epoxyqueuosine(34) reductase QueG, partial [Alphaproteobacteria bacterium]
MPISTSDIRAQALSVGFDCIGITGADFGVEPGVRLKEFIAESRHGDMDWLAEKADRRQHPQSLWPEARSVLMLGLNYGPDEDPLRWQSAKDRGVISVYAQGRDYHDMIKKRLKRLGRWLIAQHGGEIKVFVDTAPVMEKPLAARAGLGWQGKHTNLLSREFGSWLFLGAIFTTIELEPDAPVAGDCGSCTACLDICPTNAFPAPYQLDARRCISYLTIETRRHIPREMRPLIGNRIYGCDDCLAICPWNKYASEAAEMALHPELARVAPRLRYLVTLDDAAFRELFKGSAVKRLGRNRFIRNVLIALGNEGKASSLPLIEPLLSDPSPIVRLAAVWALRQIADKEIYHRMRDDFVRKESDADVI